MAKQKPIVIANWKMKLSSAESQKLAMAIKNKARGEAEIVICPSFISLAEVGKVLAGSAVKLGAQDCFWESSGAFTGEVSAQQLKEVGCDYVILGHSERRQHLAETDEMVHKKVKIALSSGLAPIICVGETFQERQDGAKDYILIQQVTKALEGVEIKPEQKVVVAYEPVWVIGSGQAIEPQEAMAAHQVIYQTLLDLFPLGLVGSNFRIIYGGSVDESNVASFTRLENTFGVLVGGASLKADDFLAIIKNV